jgi:hypothetical protein
MAFYADIFGFIAVRKGDEITPEIVAKVSDHFPSFVEYFSSPKECKDFDYISFAANLKINADEDDLWLSSFEEILRRINFFNANVVFLHEERPQPMMYSYVKHESIIKISGRMTEEIISESVL